MAAEMPLYDFLLFVFLVPILLNYLIVIDFVAIKQIYTWLFLTIPLLDEAGVAIVPGSAFGEGGEGCARISYAYSVSHISQALERIASFMEKEKARG